MPKNVQKPSAGGDLLKTADVAKLAKVDVATVNRWAKSGRLPVAVQVPGETGARLFRRSDVDHVLDELTAELEARMPQRASAS